jgi:L-asparagine oxygenase
VLFTQQKAVQDMTDASRAIDGFAALHLADDERHEVAKVAAELAGTAPRALDAAEWVAAARAASCRLPLRLLERLRAFRHDAGPDAALLIRNLPVDEASLPPTPSVPQSVEREATDRASVVVAVMLQLGEIISYRNEKLGALVQNVVPVPGQEKLQSNAGSATLEMHTENAFHPYRPDHVGLFCVRSDHHRVGRLCLASIRRARPRLPEATQQVLREPRFRTEAPPSFGDSAGPAEALPILRGDPADPDVCVDFNSTHPLDEPAARAMAELRAALEEVAHPLLLCPGDLAIVDNRLTIHGRTAFQPRYDGRDRWLHRVFTHLNHRRSRGCRPENGAVLA